MSQFVKAFVKCIKDTIRSESMYKALEKHEKCEAMRRQQTEFYNKQKTEAKV